VKEDERLGLLSDYQVSRTSFMETDIMSRHWKSNMIVARTGMVLDEAIREYDIAEKLRQLS
jgi:hypothetical protein